MTEVAARIVRSIVVRWPSGHRKRHLLSDLHWITVLLIRLLLLAFSGRFCIVCLWLHSDLVWHWKYLIETKNLLSYIGLNLIHERRADTSED